MGSFFEIADFPGVLFPWHRRMPTDLWRKVRQHVYERDGGKCRYCGEPTELFECHIHHVLPLSEGGVNHPSNLKTLCKGCHEHRHPFMLSALERLESVRR
jgi:5-methylcytosine-specific restriction endonuclease McrA